MAEEAKKETTAVAPSEEKKTVSKEAKPKKKPSKFLNFFKRIGKFLKECKVELKKISWASLSSTTKNTIIVIVVIILFAALLFGLDTLFRDVVLKWLGKIPTLIANLGWGA